MKLLVINFSSSLYNKYSGVISLSPEVFVPTQQHNFAIERSTLPEWNIRGFTFAHVHKLRVCTSKMGDRGSTVVKALCYKSEGRWFDPNWCQ